MVVEQEMGRARQGRIHSCLGAGQQPHCPAYSAAAGPRLQGRLPQHSTQRAPEALAL